MASVGKRAGRGVSLIISKAQFFQTVRALSAWLEQNDYRIDKPIDDLGANYLRPLEFL